VSQRARLRFGAVIPARDEVAVIGHVVAGLRKLVHPDATPLLDFVIVCDNGSRDGTAVAAAAAGAVIVTQPQPGYGIACLTALAALEPCDAVVFVDGDGSIDAQDVTRVCAAIGAGADLALGRRPAALTEHGAMTLPQRIGTNVAVQLIGLLFGHWYRDLGPLRAIRSDALERIDMHDVSYGWTVEMQVKALLHGLDVVEIPVRTLRRVGRSKISGTVRGVIGAGMGIIGTILSLRWRSWQSMARALRGSGGAA
jgi:glycosyltransferase involved in cell wall biosynthesis